MNQFDRMASGMIYDTTDEELAEVQGALKEKLWEFNMLRPSEREKREAYMKEVFAECGEGCCIELPFRASWGGKNVHFGNGVYANYNLTLIDDGQIYIGDRVLFGPNVIVATATHTLEPELRRRAWGYCKEVHIDENVWIGAGAIILPGVHIGKNSVIGAGSVVVRDIPENVLAVGNPCRVIREIGEQDKIFFDHDRRIDWENLKP